MALKQRKQNKIQQKDMSHISANLFWFRDQRNNLAVHFFHKSNLLKNRALEITQKSDIETYMQIKVDKLFTNACGIKSNSM